MFSRFFKTRLEWRRVAVFQPVTVAATGLVNEDGSDRQSILAACQAGMRVVLRREPSVRDPQGVGVLVSQGRQIGQLPAEAAEWIAPLLDSGKTEFDAEIWSLEPNDDDKSRERIVCRLQLTQHDLVPVRRFSWSAWLKRDGQSRSKVRVS